MYARVFKALLFLRQARDSAQNHAQEGEDGGDLRKYIAQSPNDWPGGMSRDDRVSRTSGFFSKD